MKKSSLSAAFLKHIAYISMFIDHFFAVVFSAYVGLRLAQGFNTERLDVIYDIGRAVGRVALISEIPFDLAIEGTFFTMDNQNVYFTLFLGVLALCIIDKLHGHLIIQFLGVALCCVAAALLRTDYMFMGVMLIVVFYIFRKSFTCQFLVGSVAIYVGIVLLYVVRYWGWGLPFALFLESGMSEMYGMFAFIPIYFYNGQKGKQLPKACYYLFYPLHLLMLYGIKMLMLRIMVV